jgi:hypothetical protein
MRNANKLLVAVEYDVDYARSHVQAALEGLADKDVTREWIQMRLVQADELLTGAVQRLWDELGMGRLPMGTLQQQQQAEIGEPCASP